MTAVKTVEVRFRDGSLHSLPVRALTQVEILGIIDELGVKNWSELMGSEVTLDKVRFMIHAAVRALTIESTQDIWDFQRIEKNFVDFDEIAKVWVASYSISDLSKPPSTPSAEKSRKVTPYR